MTNLTTHIERDDTELEIQVAYKIAPYYPATQEQPEEGGDVEIWSSTYQGAEIELTDAERETIEQECWDDAAERHEAAEDMAADWKREQLMEDRAA